MRFVTIIPTKRIDSRSRGIFFIYSKETERIVLFIELWCMCEKSTVYIDRKVSSFFRFFCVSVWDKARFFNLNLNLLMMLIFSISRIMMWEVVSRHCCIRCTLSTCHRETLFWFEWYPNIVAKSTPIHSTLSTTTFCFVLFY